MINLTFRNSAEKSFFKENLLNLCSQSGDTLLLSSGYIFKEISTGTFSTFSDDLIKTLTKSNTTKIYIIGGQYSVGDIKGLPKDVQKNILAKDDIRITNLLNSVTQSLSNNTLKPSNMIFKYLYKSRFHSKLAIKYNLNNLDANISILLGSSNLTDSSIVEGENLDYFNKESDVYLPNTPLCNITFNNDIDLTFQDFLNLIDPTLTSEPSFNFDCLFDFNSEEPNNYLTEPDDMPF
ncbi:MAG: hypothetical protein ACRC30_00510 [Clostridium sp.]